MSTKTAPKADSKALALAAQADAPEVLTPARKAELDKEIKAAAGRFSALHGMIGVTALQLKLLNLLSGIEVACLKDLHFERYGETRGGGVAKDSPLLGPWLENLAGVTERTLRRHLTAWRNCSANHPEIATKLRTAWDAWKAKKLKAATPKAIKAPTAGAKAKPTKAQLAKKPAAEIFAPGKLTQEDLATLLNDADEWGLHELFEKPERDVTEAPPAPPNNKQQSFDFWLQDFTNRVLKDDYLKLPKTHREALLTTTKEMAAKLEESLKTK